MGAAVVQAEVKALRNTLADLKVFGDKNNELIVHGKGDSYAVDYLQNAVPSIRNYGVNYQTSTLVNFCFRIHRGASNSGEG